MHENFVLTYNICFIYFFSTSLANEKLFFFILLTAINLRGFCTYAESQKLLFVVVIGDPPESVPPAVVR